MKQHVIPLSRFEVVLVFLGIILFGALLLYIPDIRSIVSGFGLIAFGLHELGHLSAMKIKRYNIAGIVVSIRGIGVMPERPILSQDSTLIYFSGLISIIVPLFMMPFTLEFGLLFLLGTTLLSIVDMWYWWQLKKAG